MNDLLHPASFHLAAICRARWSEPDALAGGGVLVCNPIPPADALDAASIDRAIATALAEATAAGITGKRLTPFLLARLAEVTGGASIRANRALALHNAAVASELAVALSR
jgi:pseudouridine-5'-phosphate glycosidase